jgi:hypothetical protein
MNSTLQFDELAGLVFRKAVITVFSYSVLRCTLPTKESENDGQVGPFLGVGCGGDNA